MINTFSSVRSRFRVDGGTPIGSDLLSLAGALCRLFSLLPSLPISCSTFYPYSNPPATPQRWGDTSAAHQHARAAAPL